MKDKTCIIYVITKLELGGAQKVCLTLFKEFSKKNSSYLVSGKGGILDLEVEKIGKVKFLESIKNKASFLNLFYDLKAIFELFFFILKLKKKYKKIVIHTHSSKAGFIGQVSALLAGCNLRFHTVHGFGFRFFKKGFKRKVLMVFEQVIFFIATKIICVSKRDLKEGSNLFYKFSKKSLLIRAGVDEKRFLNLNSRLEVKKKIILGTISCFKPQKNLFDLIKSFSILKKFYLESEIILEIIGDGVEREKIEALIKFYGLEKNVSLLGWKKDPEKYLKNWSLFLLSSLWEGLPCSLVEAFLLKVPSICYDSGGISEVLINRKTGFLIKRRSSLELAYYISFFLEKPFFQSEIKKNLENLNLSEFFNSRMVRDHSKEYKINL